jgi:hypothetical protein
MPEQPGAMTIMVLQLAAQYSAGAKAAVGACAIRLAAEYDHQDSPDERLWDQIKRAVNLLSTRPGEPANPIEQIKAMVILQEAENVLGQQYRDQIMPGLLAQCGLPCRHGHYQ